MTILNKVSNRTMMPGITPIPDVPDAPTIGAVTDPGTDGYATVAFTPAVTGGTVTTYTATSTPGSITATSATSPITVTGLTVSTAYTFTVKGTNATATGPESAASSSFTPTPHTSYESIATQTVGAGGAASVTFSSIPSGYKHLQLRSTVFLQTSNEALLMRANGDTANNYFCHYLYGTGTAAASTNSVPTAYYYLNSGIDSTYPGSSVTDILDYGNTSKYKTIRSFGGVDKNGGSGYLWLFGGAWANTNAITSLTIYAGNGNLNQYSSFALYGIKG